MIQVDVFWSFAMGSAFAALGQKGIKRSDSMFVNKYFVFAVCYLSMIFAPSGIFLLWQYTGWETMFFYDRSMAGIWPTVFAHTNVLLGVLGFIICYKMIKAGHEMATHAVWTSAYTCMFAILTFGYDRFLYAGTLEEWRGGVKYKLTDFFQCEVFYSLLAMGIFVLPPLYYTLSNWPAEFGITGREKWQLQKNAVTSFMWATVIFVLGFFVAYSTGNVPNTWGMDRLYAFLIGQVIFGLTIFTPLFFIRSTRVKKQQ